MKLFRFLPSPAVKNQKELLGPKPMKRFIPDWYKKSEKFFITEDGFENPGLKLCLPFLDAMSAGYAVLLEDDLVVGEDELGNVTLSWAGTTRIVNERDPGSGATVPRPPGFLPNHFVWDIPWGFGLPKGWSVLVTHPLNRTDLPFHTSSGIADADGWFSWGNLPFFLRADFRGVIPRGTPIAQLIPIKREHWVSAVDYVHVPEYKEHSGNARKIKSGYYRTKFWKRKKYD